MPEAMSGKCEAAAMRWKLDKGSIVALPMIHKKRPRWLMPQSAQALPGRAAFNLARANPSCARGPTPGTAEVPHATKSLTAQ